jgi:hypothetical protein
MSVKSGVGGAASITRAGTATVTRSMSRSSRAAASAPWTAVGNSRRPMAGAKRTTVAGNVTALRPMWNEFAMTARRRIAGGAVSRFNQAPVGLGRVGWMLTAMATSALTVSGVRRTSGAMSASSALSLTARNWTISAGTTPVSALITWSPLRIKKTAYAVLALRRGTLAKPTVRRGIRIAGTTYIWTARRGAAAHAGHGGKPMQSNRFSGSIDLSVVA